MPPTYPTDIHTSDGHARLHQGHGIDAATLRADLDYSVGPTQPYDLDTDEVWLGYYPRVKWCDRLDGFGCDMNGEWHSHWSQVRAGTPGCAYTMVRPVREGAATPAAAPA